MNQGFVGVFIITIFISLLGLWNMPTSSFDEFAQWKQQYGIEFSDEKENIFRYGVYLLNLKNIQKLNQQSKGDVQYAKNQFLHLTSAQFQEKYLKEMRGVPEIQQMEGSFANQGQINWVQRGGVSPVQNQGSVGASWPFGVAQNLQTLYFVQNKKLSVFPTSYLLACCQGGLNIQNSYRCLVSHGAATSYPYPPTEKCHVQSGDFKINTYSVNLGCPSVIDALQKTTVFAYVDATKWQFYRSGVFSNCQTNINHTVSIVGYLKEYWIVKNSWGTTWGQAGFIRLSPGNTCGVCSRTYSAF